MAAAVLNLQTLEEGIRNFVVKADILLTGADLAATAVINPANFNSVYQNYALSNNVRVDRIEFSINDGITVTLSWDATTPVHCVDLEGRGMMDPGMRYGGFQNNAGAGKTGKLLISTTGASGTEAATLVIHGVKQP